MVLSYQMEIVTIHLWIINIKTFEGVHVIPPKSYLVVYPQPLENAATEKLIMMC